MNGILLSATMEDQAMVPIADLPRNFSNLMHYGVTRLFGAPTWIFVLALIICCCIAYFLGSLNFAVLISRLRYHDDVRRYGSGNAGATNMTRVYGKGAGVATLFGDFGKAVVAVTLARIVCGIEFAYLALFCCAVGHAFPCYYRFKGGKCVSVVAAGVLVLDPIPLLLAVILFVLIVAVTKYVSLGSVSAALLLPLILYNTRKNFFGGSDIRVIFLMASCLLVIFLHRENIERLLAGKENKLSFKK